MIESVKGSNAIEGIVTTDSRIKDIVEGSTPLTHDELEISGYKDALNLIHNNHFDLDIEEDVILMLHRMIESATNNAEARIYKKNNNFILEYGQDGSRRIRFKPVSAKNTHAAMEQMILAFYEVRQDSEIPVLLSIPCFILDFLCIHPFSDGNGRVSRLLSVLMLHLAGYDIVKYISFEGQINKYKASYYEALEISSRDWHENRNDYVPFIINFLQILYRCFKDLDESFTEITLKKAKKSERVEGILMGAGIHSKDSIDKLAKTSLNPLSYLMKYKSFRRLGKQLNIL